MKNFYNQSSVWKEKKWYCYGTSMTDNHGTGTYSKYLAALSGMEEHNFGKGGSGIVPALHGEDNIKSRIMCLDDGKAEADLITVEIIPNDMACKLGEATDMGDDTFLGNLNQIISYLLTNTEAMVVILIATRGRYAHDNADEKYPPESDFALQRYEWEKAVEDVCRRQGVPCFNGGAESGLGYYRLAKDNRYIRDQIHQTEEGGMVLGAYFWSKLQTLLPLSMKWEGEDHE